ncbi:hypothetical protein ACFOW4_18300 [Micromonospora sp. GCM10011542]|uniref:hypothetical protein n=1 Tax=Micromonospora sp. GCM10011542 TaxID=3317337 RepID=UPI003614490B
MTMNDPEAVRLEFRAMMRTILRQEKVGDDTLGRTVELVRSRESVEGATDEELRVELRRLHAEPLDHDDPQQITDEFTAMRYGSMGLSRPSTQGRAMAKFVANSRRLRDGEITRDEFARIMGDDIDGVRWI